MRGGIAGIRFGRGRFRYGLARRLCCAGGIAVVAIRGSGTIRGQWNAKLLLGSAEISAHGVEGEPEYFGMPVFTEGGKGDGTRRRIAGNSPRIFIADDFSDVQWVC